MLCEISSSHGGEYEALMMEAAHTSETSVDIQLRTSSTSQQSLSFIFMLIIIIITIEA
jgi:hypothetical protein